MYLKEQEGPREIETPQPLISWNIATPVVTEMSKLANSINGYSMERERIEAQYPSLYKYLKEMEQLRIDSKHITHTGLYSYTAGQTFMIKALENQYKQARMEWDVSYDNSIGSFWKTMDSEVLSRQIQKVCAVFGTTGDKFSPPVLSHALQANTSLPEIRTLKARFAFGSNVDLVKMKQDEVNMRVAVQQVDFRQQFQTGDAFFYGALEVYGGHLMKHSNTPFDHMWENGM